jgi:hypothetical protein
VTNDEYWDRAELRRFLKCEGKSRNKRWYRIRPHLAPAVRELGGVKLWNAAKVRELLEGRKDVRSPLHRSAKAIALEPAPAAPAVTVPPVLRLSSSTKAPASGRVPLLRQVTA